jgi:hypothetical protein
MTAAVNNTFEWNGTTYHITPSISLHKPDMLRNCPICRGCRHAPETMPKGEECGP